MNARPHDEVVTTVFDRAVAAQRFVAPAAFQSRWVRRLLRVGIPFAGAVAALELDQPFARLAQERPGVLPVTMVALVAGLMVPIVRRGLIAALCFAIGLLAARDAAAAALAPLPPGADALVRPLYPACWSLLAVVALGAGAAEALRPGTVLARRLYFAAASLYFTGHGLLGFIRHGDWQSIVLVVTGLTALVGVALAPRIIAAEGPAADDDEDMRALAVARENRAARVASREWREHSERRRRSG